MRRNCEPQSPTAQDGGPAPTSLCDFGSWQIIRVIHCAAWTAWMPPDRTILEAMDTALAFSYAESDSRAMTGDLEISAGRPGAAATIPTATRQTTLGKRRVVVEPADVAARTVGTTPISSEFERPPFSPLAQIHGWLGRAIDPRKPAL